MGNSGILLTTIVLCCFLMSGAQASYHNWCKNETAADIRYNCSSGNRNTTECLVCKWMEKMRELTNNCENLTGSVNVSVCITSTNKTEEYNGSTLMTFNLSDISGSGSFHANCSSDEVTTTPATTVETTPTETTASTTATSNNADSAISTVMSGRDEASTATDTTQAATEASTATDATPASTEGTTTTVAPHTETVNEIEKQSLEAMKNESGGGREVTVIFTDITDDGELVHNADPGKEQVVGSVRLDGSTYKNVRLVIIKDTSSPPELSRKSVASFVPEKPPESPVKEAYLLTGGLLAIDAYADGTSLNISSTEFKLDISQPINQTSLQHAIQSADVPNTSIGRNILKGSSYRCVFFDKEGLSANGCSGTADNNTERLSCRCDHATVFAALLSVKVVTIPDGVKVVSYICECLSILFLIATAIVLITVRNRVRGDRVKVQIALTLSLLCLHVLMVLHDAAVLNQTLCEMWAVLTHFFLLCSATWMLMEGITLLFKTMDGVMRLLSGSNAKKFAVFRYAFTLVFSVAFTAGAAISGFSASEQTYMPKSPDGRYRQCWLGEELLVATVVVPIAIILICCTLITMRMCYVVYHMSAESENYKPTGHLTGSQDDDFMNTEHVKAALKATLVLMPVLGFPWFLGFFTGIGTDSELSESVVFMYLNAIINGLQGVMLFFVYCILGKEVRNSVTKVLIRKGYYFNVGPTKTTTDSTTMSTGASTTNSKLTGITSATSDSTSSTDEKAATNKL